MPPKVVFQMIVFQSAYILAECLESVLPYGKVIATEGPVDFYQRLGYKTSTDGTNTILEKYQIPTIHGQWIEKDEMVNAGLGRIPEDTDYVWVLDSDEIWRPGDIENMLMLLERDHYDSVSFRAWSYYGGFDRVMTGFEEDFEVHRIQRWYPGARWATHRPPTVNAPDGRPWREHKHLGHDVTDRLGFRFFHYSYVWPKQMRAKAAYYSHYDPRGTIPHYFTQIYLPWVLGNDRIKAWIEDKFDGVHNWLPERRGPCRTRAATVAHPDIIQKSLPWLAKLFDSEMSEYVSLER